MVLHLLFYVPAHAFLPFKSSYLIRFIRAEIVFLISFQIAWNVALCYSTTKNGGMSLKCSSFDLFHLQLDL